MQGVRSVRASRHRRWVSAAALAGGMALAQLGSAPPAMAHDNGQALTPPMGWNSWNKFGCTITENKVKAVVDAIVDKGLDKLGYRYVTVDDCWMAPQRDSAGALVADPLKFPGGMKGLADYVHGKGLRFGIYESPTQATCQHKPGSYGHEQQDADTFAAWGVDYLKYDWCQTSPTESPQMWADFPGRTEKEIAQTLFARMRDALAHTGRPLTYSLSNCCSALDIADWAAPVANVWRTSTDISDNWNSALSNFRLAAAHTSAAGPGHWNDPDMLEVGNGGMTDAEYRTHFSLWAQLAAPLIMGHDVPSSSAATLQILKNKDVLAVDQDSLGRQGRIVIDNGSRLVTARRLAGGDLSVTLTNNSAGTATVTTDVTQLDIGGASSYSLKDLWSQQTSTTTGAISATLAPHATTMYRITPVGTPTPGPPADGTYEIASLASRQVLDDPNSSTTAGTRLITWTRNNAANQRWTLTANGDGTYALKNTASGLCADVSGSSTAPGAPVIQWTCHGGANQRFTPRPVSSGGYTLVAQHSGQIVTASGTGDNATLTQQPLGSTPTATQAWALTRTG